MKLSIITINYNNKAGLQKTIDSVICQTWKDYEWIIIDGGSTDGSKELIEQYQQYFAYWCSEPDKGVYNAMNKGITKAKGEYLNFMNSGDCFVCDSTLMDVFFKEISADIVAGPVLLSTGQRLYQYQENIVEKHEVKDRFYHYWVTNDNELYSLYHHAQYFVYPSEYEGFGIPILEAYQANCPVLLNNASCFPEIAGDAAVYFNMDSEKSNLAEQLERLLSMSREERKTLLTRQKERLAKYSWEESAKQLAAIYQSLC